MTHLSASVPLISSGDYVVASNVRVCKCTYAAFCSTCGNRSHPFVAGSNTVTMMTEYEAQQKVVIEHSACRLIVTAVTSLCVHVVLLKTALEFSINTVAMQHNPVCEPHISNHSDNISGHCLVPSWEHEEAGVKLSLQTSCWLVECSAPEPGRLCKGC